MSGQCLVKGKDSVWIKTLDKGKDIVWTKLRTMFG